MSIYKKIMLEQQSLNEFSIATGVAKILAKLAQLAGKDHDVINDPGVKSAAGKYSTAIQELRVAIEAYEKLNGKLPQAAKALTEV